MFLHFVRSSSHHGDQGPAMTKQHFWYPGKGEGIIWGMTVVKTEVGLRLGSGMNCVCERGCHLHGASFNCRHKTANCTLKTIKKKIHIFSRWWQPHPIFETVCNPQVHTCLADYTLWRLSCRLSKAPEIVQKHTNRDTFPFSPKHRKYVWLSRQPKVKNDSVTYIMNNTCLALLRKCSSCWEIREEKKTVVVCLYTSEATRLILWINQTGLRLVRCCCKHYLCCKVRYVYERL